MPSAQHGPNHVTVETLQDVADMLAFIMDDLMKIRVRLNKEFDLGCDCEWSYGSCGNPANDMRNGKPLCNVHAELADELYGNKYHG